MTVPKLIFLNGRMVQARAELIDSLSPGIVQGKGVFETMRIYNGIIFALDKHINRLLRGCRLFNIRFPYSKARLKQKLYETVRINACKNAKIRLAVWKDHKQVRIAIICQNIKVHAHPINYKVMISSIQRKKTKYTHIKAMDYRCFRAASDEASRKGYDEAILLNNKEEVVEGSRTNIFIIRKGILSTPAVKSGCLNGITRQIVIQCARQRKIPVKAVSLDVRELLRADELFVTNAVIGMAPVICVGDHGVGEKKAGPLTRELLSAYNTIVHLSCSINGKSV